MIMMFMQKKYLNENFMKIILSLFLFILFQFAHADDIEILVFEKGTGDPLADVTVALEGAGEFSQTNADGKVKFEAIDLPDNLKALGFGYQTVVKQVLPDTKTIKVYLEPLSFEGDTITVVEDRISEKASKVSLSAREIITAPGTGGDPLKVVSSLPGIVSAVNTGGGPPGGGYYVRGSDQNENTVWVNNIPIGYLYHFGGLYSTINPELLSDFNVFLGGFPVEYPDVLGGVLDIKLRKPRKDRLYQKYSIGTYQSSVFLEGPIGDKQSDHGFFFAARRSYIDLLLSPEAVTSFFEDDEDKDKPDDQKNKIIKVPVFHDIQAIWEYESPYGLMRTSYYEASDEFKAIFNENRILDPQTAGEFGVSAGYKSLSYQWERRWNNRIFHSVPVVLSQNSTRFKFGTDVDGAPFFFDLESRDLFIQPELSVRDSLNNIWILGNQFVYSRTPIDAKITRQPNEGDIGESDFTSQKKFSVDRVFRSASTSPYVKYRRSWSDKFETTLGMRYSYVRISGGAEFESFLPRFSYQFEFQKNSWFTGAWGKYVQLPKGSELADGTGNPRLNFTRAEHRILGLKHIHKDIWTYQIEIFQKPMSQLVLPLDDNDPPDNYSNGGKGTAYGLDLLVKRSLSQGMTGWLSYSYIRTTRTGLNDVSRPFSGDQPHTLTALWSQKLSGGWSKWTLGFRFQWHSGTPYDPVIGKVDVPIEGTSQTRPVPVYPETKNSARLPDFYQLDVRVERKILFNTWRMAFYFDVQNILNTKNTTEYDYGDNYENIDNPEAISGSVLFPAFGVEAEF